MTLLMLDDLMLIAISGNIVGVDVFSDGIHAEYFDCEETSVVATPLVPACFVALKQL